MGTPMTFGQLSVLRSLQYAGSVEQLDANLPQMWDIPDGTSADAVTAAWWQLVRRNDSLRTTYEWDSSPAQVVQPFEPGVLPTVELAEPTPEAAYAVAMELASTVIRPDRDQPWRASLAVHAGRPVFLVVIVHHMAIDGYGYAELQGQFRAILAGEEPPQVLSPTELAQEQHANQAQQQSTLNYWARVWPSFNPEDRQNHTGAERVQGAMFSERALAAATDLATRLRIPAQSICLGVCFLALSAIHGRPRVTLALMSSNRFTPRLRGVISSMNQLAPVAVEIDPAQPPEEFLRQVFRKSMEAYGFGMYDVDALLQHLTDAAVADPNPMRFSSYFNFVGDDGTPDDAPLARDSVVWQPTTRRAGATFNLFVATRGGIYAVARASRDYMDEAKIAGLLTNIEAALVDISETRPATIGAIDLSPLRPVDPVAA